MDRVCRQFSTLIRLSTDEPPTRPARKLTYNINGVKVRKFYI